MDLTPKTTKVVASHLPPLSLYAEDEMGVQRITGYVVAVSPVDPIYGADEGTRLALVLDENPKNNGALVAMTLSASQMPDLRTGNRVVVQGCQEPLTIDLVKGVLEFGTLAALSAELA